MHFRQARGKSAKEADLPWEENILHPNRAGKKNNQKQNIWLQTDDTTQQFERQQIKVFLFHHRTVGSDSQVKVVKQQGLGSFYSSIPECKKTHRQQRWQTAPADKHKLFPFSSASIQPPLPTSVFSSQSFFHPEYVSHIIAARLHAAVNIIAADYFSAIIVSTISMKDSNILRLGEGRKEGSFFLSFFSLTAVSCSTGKEFISSFYQKPCPVKALRREAAEDRRRLLLSWLITRRTPSGSQTVGKIPRVWNFTWTLPLTPSPGVDTLEGTDCSSTSTAAVALASSQCVSVSW